MNWVDFVIIGIIVLSALISLIRGFVKEAISLVVWIAAFWIALAFCQELSQLNVFNETLKSPSVRIGVAFLVLFLATLIVGALVNYLISTLVNKTGLSGTDRLLGVVFGAGRGVLVVAAVLLLTSYTTLAQESWWKESSLIPQFKPVVEWLRGYLPENVNDTKLSRLIRTRKSA